MISFLSLFFDSTIIDDDSFFRDVSIIASYWHVFNQNSKVLIWTCVQKNEDTSSIYLVRFQKFSELGVGADAPLNPHASFSGTQSYPYHIGHSDELAAAASAF